MEQTKKLKVALDVDGIIADFYKACCDFFNEPHGKLDSWSVSWIFHNEHIINAIPEFWENMPVMPQAENGIDFEFDVYLSAYPPAMHDARKAWLIKNGFPDKPLIHSDDKVSFCKATGFDVLIDDKPATIREADIAGLKRIFYIGDLYVTGYCAELNPITNFSEIKNELLKLN